MRYANRMQVLKRRAALAAGESRYFTGKPCPAGHVVERYASDGTCAECKRLQFTVWSAANREKFRACKAAYRAANSEKVKASGAAYRAANPEMCRINVHNRRSRKLAAPGTFTAADVAARVAAQRGKCAYCRVKLGANFHRDHVMPLALGGTNMASNIQLLCAPCNHSKGAKHPVEFAQARGMLC